MQTTAANDQQFMHEQNQKSDLIRWQQELESELDTLIHDLKSEAFNAETEKWTQKTIDGVKVFPFVTDEGLQMVITEVKPLLSKNLINSNLNEDRILNILRGTMDTIVDNLSDNFDVYVIQPSPSRMSHIVRLIKNVVIPTPFRALDGWTKIQDNMGIKRIETYSDTQNQNKQKMFGLFGGN